jgi:hypothetical protein
LRWNALPGYPPERWPAARRFPAPELNRVDLETLFQTAERDAYRLLKRFGARAAGDTLLVSRDVLVARLEKIRQSRDYRAYLRRAPLRQAEAAETDRKRRARRQALPRPGGFVGLRCADLPAGVEIHPGHIAIAFPPGDAREALARLLDVARAARDDPEEFFARLGAPPPRDGEKT